MKSSAVVLINDRIELKNLPEDIQSILRHRGLLTSGGEKVSFCGLLQSADKNYVFLPRAMKLEHSSLPCLFSAIRKYSRHTANLIDSRDEGQSLHGNSELLLINEILTDYRQNGIYTRRTRLTSVDRGKPNWSKTIKNFAPFFGRKGPVYLNYIGSSSLNQQNSEVSRIHAYIVKQLEVRFAEILFGASFYKDDGLPSPQRLDESYLISTLTSELQRLYSDRDIRLISALIRYVQRLYGPAQSSLLIGIKGFHSLWEHMLRFTISGAIEINAKFSIPTYLTIDGEHLEAPNKGQRTDIIVYNEESNIYGVIDAKYYQAEDLKSAPGWSDLLKQFFYAKAVKSLYPDSTVKNYFIFPGQKGVFRLAYMKQRQTRNSDKLYPEIHCLYVDPQEVIEAFIEDSVLEALSKQVAC